MTANVKTAPCACGQTILLGSMEHDMNLNPTASTSSDCDRLLKIVDAVSDPKRLKTAITEYRDAQAAAEKATADLKSEQARLNADREELEKKRDAHERAEEEFAGRCAATEKSFRSREEGLRIRETEQKAVRLSQDEREAQLVQREKAIEQTRRAMAAAIADR
jgi:chromosome segregation ATPase